MLENKQKNLDNADKYGILNICEDEKKQQQCSLANDAFSVEIFIFPHAHQMI